MFGQRPRFGNAKFIFAVGIVWFSIFSGTWCLVDVAKLGPTLLAVKTQETFSLFHYHLVHSFLTIFLKIFLLHFAIFFVISACNLFLTRIVLKVCIKEHETRFSLFPSTFCYSRVSRSRV
ncbi:unnamed protein product [Ixodes persulcatus]